MSAPDPRQLVAVALRLAEEVDTRVLVDDDGRPVLEGQSEHVAGSTGRMTVMGRSAGTTASPPPVKVMCTWPRSAVGQVLRSAVRQWPWRTKTSPALMSRAVMWSSATGDCRAIVPPFLDRREAVRLELDGVSVPGGADARSVGKFVDHGSSCE
jgi:hypothetical protein